MRRFLFLAVLACLAVPAAAEKAFPFDAFRAATLKQLLIDEGEHSQRDQYSTPGSRIFHPPERLKVLATFTGDHRPLTATTARFIELYCRTRPGNEAWGAEFVEEWQFEVEGRTWWLPVQRQVTAFFPKELRPGDKIELYAVYLGIQWLEKDFDVMIMVEEFQSVGHG